MTRTEAKLAAVEREQAFLLENASTRSDQRRLVVLCKMRAKLENKIADGA